MPLTNLGVQSRLVVPMSMLAEDPIDAQHGLEHIARGDVIFTGDILDRLTPYARAAQVKSVKQRMRSMVHYHLQLPFTRCCFASRPFFCKLRQLQNLMSS